MSDIRIRGIEDLQHKLGNMARVHDILEPPMQRSLFRLQASMAKYPPPSGNYARTGTLGRRWTVAPIERSGGSMRGKVGNNTKYAPFVQSKQFQMAPFRNRWQTDDDVVEMHRTDIINDFENAISDAIKKR